MKKTLILTYLFIVILSDMLAGQSVESRVLIYTRNGAGYVHDNIAASVKAVSALCLSKGFAVEVSDNSAVFTKAKLDSFAVIIFCNSNNQAFTNDEQRNAFMRYIQNGGGFVGIHSACGSERDWPWFWAMLGGKFVRHPVLQPFNIKIIDKQHPSTVHLPDPWLWEDECYYMDHLNPDIHVLLAADLTTINDPERAAYPGVTFGELFPLAWHHKYDGGRQFYTALGHKIEHYTEPSFLKHLEGGILWVINKD